MSPLARLEFAVFRGRNDGVVTVHFVHRREGVPSVIERLEPAVDLVPMSGIEFGWGYLGSGPSRLSLAVLRRYFEFVGLTRDRAAREALAVYQAWKVMRVSRWQGATWEISVRDISADLAVIDAARRKEASDV